MRRLIYQVAVGPRRPLWDRCIATVERYATSLSADYHCQTEPLLRIVPRKSCRSESALSLGYLPIFEKANAFALLDVYDEIAIIDADVYAKWGALNIFEAVPQDVDFSAAIERKMPITGAYAQKIRTYSKMQFGRPDFPFMNMGVMVVRSSLRRFFKGQSPRQFIERPEFEKYVNGEGSHRWATDQVLLNTWVAKAPGMGVHPLPWSFNCLYGAVRASHLPAASLVHFFLSGHLAGDDPEEMLRTGTARARV